MCTDEIGHRHGAVGQSTLRQKLRGTDIHIHNGKLSVQPPTVIGHEFVGKLEDCDPAGGCGIQSQGR